MADDAYIYYRHDNATFRGKPTGGGKHAPAAEVHVGGAWRPYAGDMLEPSMFGSRITREEAEAE